MVSRGFRVVILQVKKYVLVQDVLKTLLETGDRDTVPAHSSETSILSKALKTLLPPRMQAQFLNSPFLIASQVAPIFYCPRFLFPAQ